MNSPLLFPVRFKDNKILVLDETQIPFKESYIEVDNFEKALVVLREMKTRSLGQVFLFFYSCLLFKDNFSIEQISQQFKTQRPTFDFDLLGQILRTQIKENGTFREAVDNFISSFDRLRKDRAKRLAYILPKPANILTICNVNGELIYLYEELARLGKVGLFYASETRPYLQGTRLTFWELRRNNIPCKLICDNQVASLMKEGKINCLITGADRANKDGDIINKIGTYSLACLAKHFNIPFYALTQYPQDYDIESIEIEERPKEEVFAYLDEDYSKVDAVYPCFDITKKDLISETVELKA